MFPPPSRPAGGGMDPTRKTRALGGPPAAPMAEATPKDPTHECLLEIAQAVESGQVQGLAERVAQKLGGGAADPKPTLADASAGAPTDGY